MTDWKIHLHLNIHGSQSSFGHGFTLWYGTRNENENFFNGLAFFLIHL